MLEQRLLTTALLLPLVVAVVWAAPAWLFTAVVVAFAVLAQHELYRMFARVGVVADTRPGLVLGALVVASFAAPAPASAWAPSLAVSLAVAGSLALALRHQPATAPPWAGVALTLLGICYCAWLLGHAVWLRARPDGPGLLLFLLATTWAGESTAYLVGRAWGRHKLAPRVSPGKTVEGAVAQLVASVAVALLAALTTGLLPLRHAVATGALIGIVSQIGDLAESLLKRSAQTKDSGALLPGHGGMLDRLDSLLFAVPGLYYYLRLFVHG